MTTGRAPAKERQELLAFGGLLVIGLTVVVVVLVVQDDWSATRWAAVAAIAAGVQSFAVIGALVFAKRQVDQNRVLASERRSQEMIDRLASVTFDLVQPAVDQMLSELRTLRSEHQWWNELETTTDTPAAKERIREVIERSFGESRSRLSEVSSTLRTAMARLERSFIAAGYPEAARTVTLARLRRSTLIYVEPQIGKLNADEVEASVETIAKAWEVTRISVMTLVAAAARLSPDDRP